MPSKCCLFILVTVILSVLLPFVLTLGFFAHILQPLFVEYAVYPHDDPGATLDYFLSVLTNYTVVQRLTTFNWPTLLSIDDYGEYSTKSGAHSWIFLLGNDSCQDNTEAFTSEPCRRYTAAFDGLVEGYYVHPERLANNASLFTLDCDFSPFLCDAWHISPPGLVHIVRSTSNCTLSLSEESGSVYTGFDNGPPMWLECPYEARWMPLPLGFDFTFSKTRRFPDEKEMLRTMLEEDGLYEVIEAQDRLIGVGNFDGFKDWRQFIGELVVETDIALMMTESFSWWKRDTAKFRKRMLDERDSVEEGGDIYAELEDDGD